MNTARQLHTEPTEDEQKLMESDRRRCEWLEQVKAQAQHTNDDELPIFLKRQAD